MTEGSVTAAASVPAADRCPSCGAATSEGRLGCQNLWDEIQQRSLTDLQYAVIHDLAFDAYCMQHVETYCRSAKSYVAHLTRLCCGLEYSGSRSAYSAIQAWLSKNPSLEKPQPLLHVGQMTIADVSGASSGDEHSRRVRAWASSVWQAYAPQHHLARAWIEAALGHGERPQTRRKR